MKLPLAIFFAALAGAAQAQSCVAQVNAQELILVPEAMGAPSPGLRERLSRWPGRSWDRAWGERVACDSAAVMHFLGNTMRLDQTDGYCLAEDDAHGWLLVPGARNYRGRCTRTACDRVNVVAGGATNVGQSILGMATGRKVDSSSEAVTAVAHGTGAYLLTGQASAVATALGQASASVAAALGTPAAIGATAVTVMAVGGAVYMCSD